LNNASSGLHHTPCGGKAVVGATFTAKGKITVCIIQDLIIDIY